MVRYRVEVYLAARWNVKLDRVSFRPEHKPVTHQVAAGKNVVRSESCTCIHGRNSLEARRAELSPLTRFIFFVALLAQLTLGYLSR